MEEWQWVCRRCGCACSPDGSRHTGGGPGMRACRQQPDPIRRVEMKAEARAAIAAVRDRLGAR